jgi:hypothetical protein
VLFESANEFAKSSPTAAPVKARSKTGLTDTALKALRPKAKAYKVSDGKGMYVMVSPSGTKMLNTNQI